MLMRSLSLACMIWLFAETQQEMRLLASEWLATPALEPFLFLNLLQISSAEKNALEKKMLKL